MRTKKRDPRGSLWSKWDLHFHTPASFDYGDKKVTDEEIIEGLRAANVSAVAITDHHTIDVDRLEALTKLAGDDITIFPGIELRCELGGSESVHYIGIFPETVNVGELWTVLQGRLGLTPSEVAAKTDEKCWVGYDKGMKAIKELGGLVSVHAGKKTNTFESIKNVPKFKQSVKTEILRDLVDILEVQSDSDAQDYLKIVFPSVKFQLPIVVGSDNHNIRHYSTRCPCWVRGDLTFQGLKHVLCEPSDRVFLGETPPIHERVLKNRTRYIRSVEIRKSDGASFSEKWFDCDVPLNHGLVAIIGNKGGGKSALADIIGHTGNSRATKHFSFLTNAKFCLTSNNKAKFYKSTLHWESEKKSERPLSDQSAIDVESLKYLPQDYIERVCNELQELEEGGFSSELTSVIFSHVSPSDRLGCESFEDLLQYKTAEKIKAVDVIRESLKAQIKFLASCERLSSTVSRQMLEAKIVAKTNELEAHALSKPREVEVPVQDESTKVANEEAIKKIAILSQQVDEFRYKMQEVEARHKSANRKVAAADRFLTRLASFEAGLELLKSQSVLDCADLGIDVDKVLQISINKQIVTDARELAYQDVQLQLKLKSEEEPEGLPTSIRLLEKSIMEVRESLDEPQKKRQQYLNVLKRWEEQHKGLLGDAQTPETLVHFESQLRACDTAFEKIPSALQEVLSTSREVYRAINELSAVYSELYLPVQQFIESHPLAKAQFQMSFETRLIESRFADVFLSRIAQNKRGTFSGSAEGKDKINSLIREADFNSEESAMKFLLAVWNSLHYDQRHEDVVPRQVLDQLGKGVTAEELYSYIFGFEYLSPFYTLRWAGKDLQQLSPGERGTLLLVFYLLIDKSDVPLIIDQPEENLDNQTVYNVLVPSIKEARSRRQIIIVTHNPNLAVVCDADQVISASIDKENGNEVRYESGSIESYDMNKKVLDILEGTRPAFDNRDSKYHYVDETKL